MNDIDEYIANFSGEIKERLILIRRIIANAAPQAKEKISYQMPAFYLNGNLVYFAAHKKHIGFYPTSSAMVAFAKELAEFKTSKGAIQFPYNKPLPITLVREIVLFRAKENQKNE